MIRHSALMLLVYLVLIGSAGWLLVTTPQGFIPAQDRGYVIVSAQLPGAASLARTTEIVREIEKIALDTPGIIRVAVFAGLSGATRTQASNAAALFPVFEEPEVRLKKGLSAAKITGELRKRLSALEGAFIIVIPPPSIPGIGTGGGFTMRIQDRQGRGPELLAAATDELVAAARKAPGLTSVFSPFTANTPQLFVDIDRIKAQKLGVPIQNVTEAHRDLFRLGLCQRLQLSSAAPITSPRRPICRSARRPPISPACAPAMPPATWCMLGSVVSFHNISGPDRVARYNLYPSSELQGDTLAGNQFGDRDRHHEAAGGANAAERIFLRLDRPVLSAGHRRQFGPLCISDLRAVRVPGAGRAIWQLEPAVRRHPDRADVPACRRPSACGSWGRTSTS